MSLSSAESVSVSVFRIANFYSIGMTVFYHRTADWKQIRILIRERISNMKEYNYEIALMKFFFSCVVVMLHYSIPVINKQIVGGGGI